MRLVACLTTAITLCTIGALCLAVARPASAQRDADQHGLPFDDADTWRQGRGIQSLSADKGNGRLAGHVQVKTSGSMYNAWGECEARVRWAFTDSGAAPCLATAAVGYTTDDLSVSASGGSVESSSANAVLEVGVRVTDVASGQATTIVLESRDEVHNILSPMISGAYRYSPNGFVFQPGRAYHIDVFLHLGANAYSEVNALTKQVMDSADASASGIVTVTSVRLQNISPPWIETSIRKPNSPAADTYDVYEQALQDQTGRPYFQSGCWVTVSAGGLYDSANSSVVLRSPEAPILKLSGCTLPAEFSGDRRQVTLTLPPSAELALGGGTWRFVLVFDPEFRLPWDDVEFAPKLLAPVVGAWMELDRQATGKGALPVRADSGGAGVAPRGAGAPRASGTRVVSAGKLPAAAKLPPGCDPRDFALIMPARRFMELTQGPRAPMPKQAKKLQVSLWTPPGVTKPKLDTAALAVKPAPAVQFHGPEFSSEPWVIVSVLELWQQLCLLELPNGMTLCANPAFIRLLENLAQDAAAYREYLDSLYYLSPGGKTYKLTNLVEEMAADPPQITIGKAHPVVLYMLLPQRLVRWIRRAVLGQAVADMLRSLRPTQPGSLSVSGRVRNAAGQEDSSSAGAAYNVVFDFVPRPQAQPLATQDSISP